MFAKYNNISTFHYINIMQIKQGGYKIDGETR